MIKRIIVILAAKYNNNLYIFIRHTPYLPYRGVGTQQLKEERQEGKNEEKTDRGKRQNHPARPKQLKRVWVKKKRAKKRRKNKRKKQGMGSQPSYLDRLVASYDSYGSYGGPILKNNNNNKIIIIIESGRIAKRVM